MGKITKRGIVSETVPGPLTVGDGLVSKGLIIVVST